MYIEALALADQSFAQIRKISDLSSADSNLESLRQEVEQVAFTLQRLSLQQNPDLLQLKTHYCILSDLLSGFVNLRSKLEPRSDVKHQAKRQKLDIDITDQFPNALVLQCMHWTPIASVDKPARSLVHQIYPLLNHATHNFSISYPNLLGVVQLSRVQFLKLSTHPKPRCLGLVDVRGQTPYNFVCVSEGSLCM